MTPEIRKALEAMGEATVSDLADRLHLQDFAALRQLTDALKELVRRGVVAKEDRPPVYRLAGIREERGEKQQAIWRAVRVEALGFTYKMIMLLTGASHDYTRRYLTWLTKQGLIVRAGVRGVQDGVYRPEVVYKVAPGKEKMVEAPHWARLKEEGRKAVGSRR